MVANVADKTKTTIAITKGTMLRLANLGKFNDTYEDIIKRLLDSRTKRKGKG